MCISVYVRSIPVCVFLYMKRCYISVANVSYGIHSGETLLLFILKNMRLPLCTALAHPDSPSLHIIPAVRRYTINVYGREPVKFFVYHGERFDGGGDTISTRCFSKDITFAHGPKFAGMGGRGQYLQGFYSGAPVHSFFPGNFTARKILQVLRQQGGQVNII